MVDGSLNQKMASIFSMQNGSRWSSQLHFINNNVVGNVNLGQCQWSEGYFSAKRAVLSSSAHVLDTSKAMEHQMPECNTLKLYWQLKDSLLSRVWQSTALYICPLSNQTSLVKRKKTFAKKKREKKRRLHDLQTMIMKPALLNIQSWQPP